jgi:hypothetical protein
MGPAEALCMNFLSESLVGAAISNSGNEVPIGKRYYINVDLTG